MPATSTDLSELTSSRTGWATPPIGFTLSTYGHSLPSAASPPPCPVSPTSCDELSPRLSPTHLPRGPRQPPHKPLSWEFVEPRERIELSTYALRVRCSTD